MPLCCDVVIFEALLYCSLIGGTCVLQLEGHCSVAESSIRGDERGLDLIFFPESYLVIPRVAIEEAKESASNR